MIKVNAPPRTVAILALGMFALLTLAILLASLESTQEKSRRLAKHGTKAFSRQGLRITAHSATVDVVSTSVIRDPNGAAVAVILKNTSNRAVAGVPIAIDVLGRTGASVFRNDEPGLEPSLTIAPVLAANEVRIWVHDQVYPTAEPSKVKAEVGAEAAAMPADVPRIEVAKPSFADDPSGLEARGYIYNRSKIEQRKLVIFAAARRGNRVIAAGRGQVQRLKAGRRARYTIFFIGDPRRGRLELWAPPAVLQAGAEPVGETAPAPPVPGATPGRPGPGGPGQ